uniref:Initiation factor 1 n=1 Tax=Firmiana kwangsiensis TaxID=1863013 RepID=A0A8K1RJ10_9ROSI|nr:initiation factor 1 [Firmiana kwangsiensis]
MSESLPLRIPLDNEDLILGYVSGRIRSSFIRIPPWDRVNKSEVSAYDSTRGRIIDSVTRIRTIR